MPEKVIYLSTFRQFRAQAPPFLGKRVLLLSDQRVFALHGERLLKRLPQSTRPLPYLLPPGERQKSLAQATAILSLLEKEKFLRDDTLLTLGGGVVSDLGGFVASIYMRGIAWVALPTTLLSMVDAAIGGKTAVNLHAKNLVGSFYPPLAVFYSLDFLDTLPDRIFFEGMAEVVKYGVIWDPSFFSFLEREKEPLKSRHKKTLESAVQKSVEIKRTIVKRDPREGDLRRILNFGHTLAHALEASLHFKLLHGEAVSLGMLYAAHLAEEEGELREKGFLERLKELLEAFSLPTKLKNPPPFERVYELMAKDKKARREGLYFVLPVRRGEVKVLPCGERSVKRAWEKFVS